VLQCVKHHTLEIIMREPYIVQIERDSWLDRATLNALPSPLHYEGLWYTLVTSPSPDEPSEPGEMPGEFFWLARFSRREAAVNYAVAVVHALVEAGAEDEAYGVRVIDTSADLRKGDLLVVRSIDVQLAATRRAYVQRNEPVLWADDADAITERASLDRVAADTLASDGAAEVHRPLCPACNGEGQFTMPVGLSDRFGNRDMIEVECDDCAGTGLEG
jgi:hypothetical protein